MVVKSHFTTPPQFMSVTKSADFLLNIYAAHIHQEVKNVLCWMRFNASITVINEASMHLCKYNALQLFSLCNQSSYPDVQLWALILLSLKDFWSSIRWTATPCGQRFPRLEEVPESKIYKGQNISK